MGNSEELWEESIDCTAGTAEPAISFVFWGGMRNWIGYGKPPMELRS